MSKEESLTSLKLVAAHFLKSFINYTANGQLLGFMLRRWARVADIRLRWKIVIIVDRMIDTGFNIFFNLGRILFRVTIFFFTQQRISNQNSQHKQYLAIQDLLIKFDPPFFSHSSLLSFCSGQTKHMPLYVSFIISLFSNQPDKLHYYNIWKFNK